MKYFNTVKVGFDLKFQCCKLPNIILLKVENYVDIFPVVVQKLLILKYGILYMKD